MKQNLVIQVYLVFTVRKRSLKFSAKSKLKHARQLCDVLPMSTETLRLKEDMNMFYDWIQPSAHYRG